MKNETFIQGRVNSELKYSHSVMGEPFYRLSVTVERESYAKDYIPVVIPGSKIPKGITMTGNRVFVKGQFRSYDCQNSLSLFVYANSIGTADSNQDKNIVCLGGFVCKAPTFRRTPLGREISDVILAVPRQYGKTDYIPCIAWGKAACFASRMSVGEPLTIEGRIQSREYTKPGESQKRTAYEVSIARLI